MSVCISAPTQPPEIGDPIGDDRLEALIEEAKHRARRRRAGYLGAALLLVIAVFGVHAAAGDDPPSGGAPTRVQETPENPPVPLVRTMDPDAGSTVVAQGGGPGWVLVYGDGRVIQSSDGGIMLERHLSQRGWDGLRSGQISLDDFLVGYDPDVNESLWWVDPEGALYEPSAYAVCSNVVTPDLGPPVRAAVPDDYPVALQPMLRGRERTFTGTDAVSGFASTPVECFQLATREALALVGYLTDPGDLIHTEAPSGTYPWLFEFTSPTGVAILAEVRPLLPHGDWVG